MPLTLVRPPDCQGAPQRRLCFIVSACSHVHPSKRFEWLRDRDAFSVGLCNVECEVCALAPGAEYVVGEVDECSRGRSVGLPQLLLELRVYGVAIAWSAARKLGQDLA